MCGQEGHGAFHTHPGGKHQGQLKCNKHRVFTEQIAEIKEKYAIDETGIRALISAGPSKKNQRAVGSTTSSLHAATNHDVRTTSSHDNSYAGSISSAGTAPQPSAWSAGSQRLHLLQALHGQGKDDESSYSPDGSSDSSQQQQQKFPGLFGNVNGQVQVQPPPQAWHSPLASGITSPLTEGNGHNRSINTGGGTIGRSSSGSGRYLPPPSPPPVEIELITANAYRSAPLLRLVVSADQILSQGTFGGTTVFKAIVSSSTAESNVVVKTWPLAPQHDLTRLNTELARLYQISAHSRHIVRVLHPSALHIEYPPTSGTFWCGVVLESCVCDLAAYVTQHSKSASPAFPPRLPAMDLQLMALQLVEAYLHIHDHQLLHRPASPSDILITRGDDVVHHGDLLFGDGFQLRLSDVGLSRAFRYPFGEGKSCVNSSTTGSSGAATVASNTGGAVPPASPNSNSTYNNSNNSDGDSASVTFPFIPNVYMAPEVLESRSQEESGSTQDAWALGCLLYYLGTCGRSLFDTEEEVLRVRTDEGQRRALLQRHGLQDSNPSLYDLVERLVRPMGPSVSGDTKRRMPVSEARCHPFLWSPETKKRVIVQLADAVVARGEEEPVSSFKKNLENISPRYVFRPDVQRGWAEQMSADLRQLVFPPFLRDDGWWSGERLLQAIRNQLIYPEPMRAALFSDSTAQEACRRYLVRVLDQDFPRLLVLLYELGCWHGRWRWDGLSVSHRWT